MKFSELFHGCMFVCVGDWRYQKSEDYMNGRLTCKYDDDDDDGDDVDGEFSKIEIQIQRSKTD